MTTPKKKETFEIKGEELVAEFKKLNAENVARIDAGIKKLLDGKREDDTGELSY